MTFDSLNLIAPILQALKTEGYETPTPIQEKAIPSILQSRDLLGCAQTGTGKTAAFAIPILQLLDAQNTADKGPKRIKTLILTPTRELAIQIDESFAAYGRNLRLKHLVIFGGVGQKPQTDALGRGVDILVATPGRLLDLINQRFVDLSSVSIFVLDEADRMLDMGFIHDVKKVIQRLPTKRQTLFFSATMPPEISQLANTILTDPIRVEVTPPSTTVERIEQMVYFADKSQKKHLLIHILQDESIKSVLVFTRTKHGANKLVKDLEKSGIRAEAIHGNKSQSARQLALSNFKARKTRVLVATDIAARGIDVEELTHVVNYELPNVPETYVHRIGRTGRAGASGVAISFCDAEEREYLRDIQKLIGIKVPVVEEHDFMGKSSEPYIEDERPPLQPRGRGNQQKQQKQAPQRSNNDRQQSNNAPSRQQQPQRPAMQERPQVTQREAERPQQPRPIVQERTQSAQRDSLRPPMQEQRRERPQQTQRPQQERNNGFSNDKLKSKRFPERQSFERSAPTPKELLTVPKLKREVEEALKKKAQIEQADAEAGIRPEKRPWWKKRV